MSQMNSILGINLFVNILHPLIFIYFLRRPHLHKLRADDGC